MNLIAQRPTGERVVDAQRFLKLTRRWALLVVVTAAIAGAAVYSVAHRMTPIYRGAGSILVVAAPRSDVSGFSLTAQQVAATDAALIHEHSMLSQVIGELHLKMTPDELDQREEKVGGRGSRRSCGATGTSGSRRGSAPTRVPEPR